MPRNRALPPAPCTAAAGIAHARAKRHSRAPASPPGTPELRELRLTGTESPVHRLLLPSSTGQTLRHDAHSQQRAAHGESRRGCRAGAVGAASAIPIPLAQLDFAGLFNAFNIDSSDSPRVLLVISAVGGVLTIAVVALAFVGSGLALAGSTAALAGLVTAMPLWIPAGILIGAGCCSVRQTSTSMNERGTYCARPA